MTPNPDPQRSAASALPAMGVDPKAERACRLANLAWHWVVTRAPYRSHLDRLRALEAAGAVPDEMHFALGAYTGEPA